MKTDPLADYFRILNIVFFSHAWNALGSFPLIKINHIKVHGPHIRTSILGKYSNNGYQKVGSTERVSRELSQRPSTTNNVVQCRLSNGDGPAPLPHHEKKHRRMNVERTKNATFIVLEKLVVRHCLSGEFVAHVLCHKSTLPSLVVFFLYSRGLKIALPRGTIRNERRFF